MNLIALAGSYYTVYVILNEDNKTLVGMAYLSQFSLASEHSVSCRNITASFSTILGNFKKYIVTFENLHFIFHISNISTFLQFGQLIPNAGEFR